MNEIANFLGIEQQLIEYAITTIIYLIYLLIAVKAGANWLTLLIGYLVISSIFTFLNLDSFLNIIQIVINFFRDLWNGINPFKNLFG